jgi:Xaa-Pro aminopeptidase
MTTWAFPIEEFKQRVARVQQALAERELDAALISRPQNVYYLTGFRSLGAGLAAGMGQIHAALVPAAGEPILYIRALETKTAARYCWAEVRPYRDYEDAYGAIAAAMPAGARRLGVEYLEVTALQLEGLRSACPMAQVEDISLLVERFRRTKSSREVAYCREACRIADAGMQAAIAAVRDGARVSSVVAETSRAMYDEGQDDITCSPALIWSGPDGGRMHDTSLEDVIARGHLVTIEITGSCHLYAGDAMGTICVGAPPKAVERAYEVSVALHDAAQRALRPGVTGEFVHAQSDAVFRDAGHGPYYRRVGGAIGINTQPSLFFEGLNLLKGETTLLEAGMTMLIQPGVDQPGMIIVASTNVITETGYEELTRPLCALIQR